MGVELHKKPGVNGGRDLNDVEIIEGFSNVLVDGNSGNEGLGSRVLKPVDTDGVREGKTVIVVNEEAIFIRSNGHRDVPSSRGEVALFNDNIASIISAASGVGDIARLKTSSTGISLTFKTLVNPDINESIADVVDLHKEMSLSSSNLRSGNVNLVMGLTLRLDVSLVGGVAGELTDGGLDEGGVEGVIETSLVVFINAEGQLNGDVPSSVLHLAGVNGEVAGELTTSSNDLFKGDALAVLTGLSVDGVVKDKLTRSGRGINTTAVDAVIKVIVHSKDSIVNGGHGKVSIVKTHDGAGRDTRDVDEEIGSLGVRTLRHLNGIEGIVVDLGGSNSDFTLVIEDDEGSSVFKFINGCGSGGHVEGVGQDAGLTSCNGNVVGSILELAANLNETRGSSAGPVVVIGTRKVSKGVNDVVVVLEFLFKVVKGRVNNVEGSKITVKLGCLVKLDAQPLSDFDVLEGVDAVIVKVTREDSAINDVASSVLSDSNWLFRWESGHDFSQADRCKPNQK